MLARPVRVAQLVRRGLARGALLPRTSLGARKRRCCGPCLQGTGQSSSHRSRLRLPSLHPGHPPRRRFAVRTPAQRGRERPGFRERKGERVRRAHGVGVARPRQAQSAERVVRRLGGPPSSPRRKGKQRRSDRSSNICALPSRATRQHSKVRVWPGLRSTRTPLDAFLGPLKLASSLARPAEPCSPRRGRTPALPSTRVAPFISPRLSARHPRSLSSHVARASGTPRACPRELAAVEGRSASARVERLSRPRPPRLRACSLRIACCRPVHGPTRSRTPRRTGPPTSSPRPRPRRLPTRMARSPPRSTLPLPAQCA